MVSAKSPSTPVAVSAREYEEFRKFKESIASFNDTEAKVTRDSFHEGHFDKLGEPAVSLGEYTEANFGGCCLARACGKAGVPITRDTRRVVDIGRDELLKLGGIRDYKILVKAYAETDKRNHVELIGSTATNFLSYIHIPFEGAVDDHCISVTTLQHFFNAGNQWANYEFYAADGSFGTERMFRDDTAGNAPAASIRAESISGGSGNVGGGVSRPRKRVVGAKSGLMFGAAGIAKNYRTTNAVLFNNADELFQDSISRAYAQEIIEEVFDAWGVPMDQPSAATYAENLLWMFFIAVTASNKADYNRVYDIPVEPVNRDGITVTSIEADFAVLSRILEAKFGVTRRQFSRGIADDLRNFLRHDENQVLLPTLASRVGCEPLLAYLAFDGSTHCTGLTTRELAFTRTLEQRNLFERDDELAAGSSDRLMQGFSGGVRSIQPR